MKGFNMASAIVTARMDEMKKRRGNAILKKRGKTPSGYINELYDRLIEKNDLLWEEERKGLASMSDEEIKAVVEKVRSIPIVTLDKDFSEMTIKQARMKRLGINGNHE